MKLFDLSPQTVSKELAGKVKHLRLLKKWKRSTLSKRSGVSESSLRRFEQSGKVSMESFLKIIHALGRINEMDSLIIPHKALSINDLENPKVKISERGTV